MEQNPAATRESATRTKASSAQMRNRHAAMPISVELLMELERRKNAGQSGEQVGVVVSSARLAKLTYAIARLREQETVNGIDWNRRRLRKKKLKYGGVTTNEWNIWIEEKASVEIENIGI